VISWFFSHLPSRLVAVPVVLAVAACTTAPMSAPPATAPASASAATQEGHRLTPAQQRQLERHTMGVSSRTATSSTMQPAAVPMPLPRAATAPPYRWRLDGNTLSIDDYFKRQPVLAVLIAKDGVIQYERYQYGLTAQHRYLSNSMAKSFTSLAMGFALNEGKVSTLDAFTQTYLPELKGTAYGETTLRNLMRMGSGVKFSETYKPDDDSTRFRDARARVGVVQATKLFNDREVPQGSRFNYASIETALIGAVLKAATGESVTNYLQGRLWQAIGAEGAARWELDRTGLELTQCCITALPHDYLRLGVVLANDGKRPDAGKQVIPLDYLLDSTDWHRADPPFRPQPPGTGYSNYFWLQGSEARRFVLLGVHGQAIFVDPANRLVMLHLAASEAAKVGDTTMARERAALWRGVVQHYGKW
jgi:CubicO group peptidase (beta-lactamase class C family)